MKELSEMHVQKVMRSHPTIGAIVDAEPIVLDLLKVAASQKNRSERWQMYEMLKYACSQFVGWDATNASLRSEHHYLQVMEALDLLLPTPEIEDETLDDMAREEVLQQLRDSILMVAPTVKFPEQRAFSELEPLKLDWNV